MKSIRLSLIIYFLALIALALGGVSALSYQTTSTTLLAKQASTEDLIEEQFQTQCREARAILDRRLLRQAHLLASKARSVQIRAETYYLASALGSGASPTGRLLSPLLVAPATAPTKDALANHMSFRELQGSVRPVFEVQIHPDAIDAIMPNEEDHPLEVFQIYRRSGALGQRSANLEAQILSLSDQVRENAKVQEEVYDDFKLNGQNMRRVTLKTPVSSQVFSFFGGGKFNKSKGPAAPKAPTPGQPKSKGSTGTQRPEFFIFTQYASDTAHVDEEISGFEAVRNERLAQSHEETRAALVHLRQRLFWISVLTFAGIIVGGFLLVRLGLAPLARLSDAVSKVSERNFQLQVDPQKLPIELRPIAERLGQTLEQLRKAFAHEKQAAADVSHELRTPLAALMITLDVALRKPRTPEEYRDILEECRHSGQHMAHLVERLMALARLDAGVEQLSEQSVDLAEFAQQCADMVRPLADEQGLTLHTGLAESIVTIIDAGKLSEILLNLLHNAIAYNNPQGSIELTVQRAGNLARLAVRDTGIGIAPDEQARLFERFYRADPSRHADTPHCGLGLAIVKSYVDLMGGTIHVESSPAGSTFEVRLPLRTVDAPTAPDSENLLQAVES